MSTSTKLCVWPECLKYRNRRGLCTFHYTTALRDGTLEDVALPMHNGRRFTEGEVRVDKQGYAWISIDSKLTIQHRYVMSQYLGRDLLPTENVHHLNGDRSDNRLENLELWFSPQPYGQRASDLISYVTNQHHQSLIDLGWTPPKED
jgi:hypothetical protein